MPIASTDEQLALQASIREWAKRARSIDVVRSLEPGTGGTERGDAHRGEPGQDGHNTSAAQLWSSLADLGVFAIMVPAAAGGAGGRTAELAAALAQLTESLAPGPILPTMLAGMVLGQCPDLPAAQETLPGIATGTVSVAVALDPGSVTGTWRPDGSLALTGQAGPVLGGGTTTHLLLSAAVAGAGEAGASSEAHWCLLAAAHPGISLTGRAPADFSRSLADVTLTEVTAAPGQVLTGVTTQLVRDLAAALFAVEAAAVASWCCRTASEYAAIRHQFGRPIGSFQAVKHLCAGLLCRAEAAAALAWDAARAADDAPDELPPIAAAAAAFNLDAAVENAKDCIQVLGGIGHLGA